MRWPPSTLHLVCIVLFFSIVSLSQGLLLTMCLLFIVVFQLCSAVTGSAIGHATNIHYLNCLYLSAFFLCHRVCYWPCVYYSLLFFSIVLLSQGLQLVLLQIFIFCIVYFQDCSSVKRFVIDHASTIHCFSALFHCHRVCDWSCYNHSLLFSALFLCHRVCDWSCNNHCCYFQHCSSATGSVISHATIIRCYFQHCSRVTGSVIGHATIIHCCFFSIVPLSQGLRLVMLIVLNQLCELDDLTQASANQQKNLVRWERVCGRESYWCYWTILFMRIEQSHSILEQTCFFKPISEKK